jgi:hypothetical protein
MAAFAAARQKLKRVLLGDHFCNTQLKMQQNVLLLVIKTIGKAAEI